jgi:hypothetical protein
VQLARSHHLLVLLDAHVERHVGLLRPPAERREPQHGVLVAAVHQLAPRVLHQKGVASVRRVARLEGVHGVGALLFEGGAQLVRGEAVVVEAVAVRDLTEELDLTAEREVLARRKQLLHVRVLVVDDTPRAHEQLAHLQMGWDGMDDDDETR